MDIRIESNIGLDIMQIECIQNMLFQLNYTYPDAPLLQIKCSPNEENLSETSVSITLFDKDKIERVWGQDRNVHVLFTRLLTSLINKKSEVRHKELPPIRPLQPVLQVAS